MKKTSLMNLALRCAGAVAIIFVALGMQPATAGIADTKHNLSKDGTGVNKFDGTGEICVFCHTPHGADTTAAVPLWNRVLSSPTVYTTYNSLGTSSLDGATAPVGSVSLACLSCHDGTQAMNVMINQPGSGGYNAAGSALAGNWTGANQTNGMIGPNTITNIGVDLKNDHPIGIQYAGGPKTTIPAVGTDYTNASFKDKDFNTAKSASLNGQSVWWVDTVGGKDKDGNPVGGGDGVREKYDMLLYTRTDAKALNLDGKTVSGTTLSGAQPYVECASCHDPHSTNTTFLRIANTGSAVCLACHIK